MKYRVQGNILKKGNPIFSDGDTVTDEELEKAGVPNTLDCLKKLAKKKVEKEPEGKKEK